MLASENNFLAQQEVRQRRREGSEQNIVICVEKDLLGMSDINWFCALAKYFHYSSGQSRSE